MTDYELVERAVADLAELGHRLRDDADARRRDLANKALQAAIALEGLLLPEGTT